MKVIGTLNGEELFEEQLSYPYRKGDVLAYSKQKGYDHTKEPDLYKVVGCFIHIIENVRETLYLDLVPYIEENT